MNTNPAHNGRPQTPDEADLLAFVEGEALPRDREAAVARALAADPALARRLERMRADRAAIRSLPAVAAPAGLLDAVEAALQPVLERQMLLGLQDGRLIESRPPVSVVQPVRRSVLATLFAERAGRRMALAAGLLLVVGGASYFAAISLRATPAPPVRVAKAEEKDRLSANADQRPITERTIAAAPRADSKPALDTLADKPHPSEHVIADAASARSAPTVPAPAEPMEVAAAKAAPAALVEASVPNDDHAPTEADAAVGIDSDRAIELAKQNRLVIRLRAPDPVVLAEPGRIADRIRKASSPMWRLGEEAPVQLASLLNAAPAPAPTMGGGPPEPFNPVVASKDEPAREQFGPPPPAPSVPAFTPPPTPTVYLVQTRLDAAALDSLRDALAPYGEPVLEESATPLPLDSAAALNPAAVVWWSQPPSGWATWGSVPVVIDREP